MSEDARIHTELGRIERTFYIVTDPRSKRALAAYADELRKSLAATQRDTRQLEYVI